MLLIMESKAIFASSGAGGGSSGFGDASTTLGWVGAGVGGGGLFGDCASPVLESAGFSVPDDVKRLGMFALQWLRPKIMPLTISQRYFMEPAFLLAMTCLIDETTFRLS